jgi:hypothetical protein
MSNKNSKYKFLSVISNKNQNISFALTRLFVPFALARQTEIIDVAIKHNTHPGHSALNLRVTKYARPRFKAIAGILFNLTDLCST